MIAPEYKRICGIHMQEQGEIGAVWMAHDKETDRIHLYDACVFKNEVLAVIAEGLNARGRWIPIAWTNDDKDLADQLLKRGCTTLYEPAQEVTEMTSRDIDERMRSKRFKVEPRLGEWLEEFKAFYKEGSQVPKGFPLMTATRIAVADLRKAKRQASKSKSQKNYPQVAMI